MAAISIVDYELPDETHNLYDITFFTKRIHTIVTHTPSFVASWIREIVTETNATLVGLDVEWRPNRSPNSDNPVATLQLCVGPRCLIFQILHAPYVPNYLADFLKDTSMTFVGIGIGEDVEKLIGDYGVGCLGNLVDLRTVAAEVMGERRLKNAGLKELARVVLGREISKPKRVTMSRWDSQWLTPFQVQYACIDAFVSFEIGRVLNVGSSGN